MGIVLSVAELVMLLRLFQCNFHCQYELSNLFLEEEISPQLHIKTVTKFTDPRAYAQDSAGSNMGIDTETNN